MASSFQNDSWIDLFFFFCRDSEDDTFLYSYTDIIQLSTSIRGVLLLYAASAFFRAHYSLKLTGHVISRTLEAPVYKEQ